MKIEEMNEKIAEKSRGCTSKITHISVVKGPIVPKIVSEYYNHKRQTTPWHHIWCPPGLSPGPDSFPCLY